MLPPRDARARIADLSARLTAAGLAPEQKEYADRTLIEAHLPDHFPETSWPEVLAALETADAYGSADQGEGHRRLWAVIRRTNRRRR